jgi:hypothetical protein
VAKLANLVATLKPVQPDGYSKARNKEEIAVALLKQVGVAEDQITPDVVEAAVAANEVFIARLEAIRDTAQGGRG